MGKGITENGLIWFLSSYTISTPLFPLLIASVISLGADPLSSAHLITVLAFAFLVFPVFYLGKEIGNEYVGYCSCILIVTSSTMWHLSTMVWTEMPFILFSVTSLLFLVKYIKNNQFLFLIIGAFFVALASIERYVGIFLVISSVLVIFIFEIYCNKQKIWRFLIFLLITSTPFFLLLMRNFIVGQSIFYTRKSMPIFDSIFYTVYFKVRGIFPSFVKPDNSAYLFLAFIILLVILHIIIIKKGNISKNALLHYFLVTSPLWVYSGIFIFLFEIVYLSWQGFGEHGRLQVVIIPVIILFAFSFFVFTYKNIDSNYKKYYTILIIALFSVTALGQISIIPQTYKNLQDGYGDFYCDPCWRNNQGIEWLKENTNDSVVYSTSNDGYQISYYLGRETFGFPCNGNNSSYCSKVYSDTYYQSNNSTIKNSSYIIIIEDYCEKKLGYRYNLPIISFGDFKQMVNNSSDFTLVKQYPDTAIYRYNPTVRTIE
ncbi:MAG: glycosyltransferase family 39 protein [Methanoregula sp.]|nr:glycosyltransferase family 39 protein [Methanoregula sp.]